MNEEVLPQDIAAEKAVLAAILLDRDSIKNILDVLDANDFSREAHKVIYKAMMSLFFHDEPELGIVIIVNMKKIPEQIQVDDLRLLLKKDNNSDYKLSIEKHIGGPVGSIDMSFDSTVLTFKEM